MKNKVGGNPMIWWVIVFSLTVTSVFGFIACYFAYQKKKMEILLNFDSQLVLFADEYMNIKDRNWESYLPITENLKYSILKNNYFNETQESITPQMKKELKDMLRQMALRDRRIEWIVLYTPERKQNYIYIHEADMLMDLPENFVYLEELDSKEKIRDIYAKKEFELDEYYFNNIVIVGGSNAENKKDCIAIGYNIDRLEKITSERKEFSTLQFCICNEGMVLYNSLYKTGEQPWRDFEPEKSGVYKLNGERWIIQIADKSMTGESIFYMVEWCEFFLHAGEWSSIILCIVLVAMLLSVVAYSCVVRSITGEVKVILDGLTVLENSQLDYNISGKFRQPELTLIAQSINQMSKTLKDKVECIITFEKLQEEAKFAELQTKYNPHFLYNTLEIFRLRCYENGDEETANMIAETAALFRGFIGTNSFIPIRDELSFCKRYLSIYHARYGDAISVLYNIDTEVLQYGIIRNVFQPLIENYFEHGYDSEKTDNYILITGRLLNVEDILFTVEDNGRGIEEGALERLRQNLNKSIVSEKESYGLRNLHQRLRIYYGEGYGLNLCQKSENGIIIEILIKRKSINLNFASKFRNR